MALVNIGGAGYFPDMQDTASGATVNFTFDAGTDLLAAALIVPATGTISGVHYNIATVTSPLLTLRTELRTVSATTGLPNAAGTLYGSSTSITSVNPTTGNKIAAVNATGATKGDMIAVVFDISAYTSGSFTMSELITNAGIEGALQGFPYNIANTTGATAKVNTNQFNCFALEYGTDTYYYLGMNAGVCTMTTGGYSNSGTTRRGNRIRSNVPMRAVGIYGAFASGQDHGFQLRLASNDSVLATCTVDKDFLASSSGRWQMRYFDGGATVNIAAGTDYYVLVVGNSAVSSNIYYLTGFPENAQLDQLSGGKNCYGTSYAGSYSDVNTDRYLIGLIYDQLDDGTGGGGGGSALMVPVGLTGGFV